MVLVRPAGTSDRQARAKLMVGTLIMVGVLVLMAYAVGYLVGRAEMDRTWRWRTRFHRIGEQMQQIYIDEPGNPRMN